MTDDSFRPTIHLFSVTSLDFGLVSSVGILVWLSEHPILILVVECLLAN